MEHIIIKISMQTSVPNPNIALPYKSLIVDEFSLGYLNKFSQGFYFDETDLGKDLAPKPSY